MKMDVIYTLATMDAVINDNSVSRLSEALLTSNLAGSKHQMPKDILVFILSFAELREVSATLWDDEEMRRRLRVDIAECHAKVVFEDHTSRDLAA